jgi:formylglycine-generating enzyme required for sulfatase activity
MSSDNNKSDPSLNRFTDGPNYTRIVDASQQEALSGGPEQWLESLPARYQLQGPIGQGGMGQVYLATDVGESGQGARQVAIKLVLGALAGSQQAYERFVQEMHIAEQLDHENIVQVLTHGKTSQGVPYLVMQYVEGGSLLDRIRNTPGQGLSVDEVIDIGMQVCTALMVAHDFGVIHRDIKPGNILVRQERYPRPRLIVKLADFGLARSLETSQHSMSAMVGTFGYRSPEQRSGGSVDVRSDLYSLGATLFHACSGEAPEGPTDWEDVPEVLRVVLRKSLTKKAIDRYAHAGEMYEALASCRSGVVAGASVALKLPESSVAKKKEISEGLVLPEELTNSIGMKFRLIQPGTFMMGNERSVEEFIEQFPEMKTWNREWITRSDPSHSVRMSKGYYLGKYAVTVGDFKRFVDKVGYKTEGERDGKGAYGWTGKEWVQDAKITWRNPGFTQTDQDPVVCVSWNDAESYCQWLSEVEGKSYRLPTESEWEYSCRAGSRTAYCFGEGEARLGEYAWYGKNSGSKTHPVGQKAPNAWGLYDMHGNVWEWCSDWYGDYPSGSVTDPTGASTGSYRVFRGGCWSDVAAGCRSALRSGYDPSRRNCNLGFRLALSSLGTSQAAERGR